MKRDKSDVSSGRKAAASYHHYLPRYSSSHPVLKTTIYIPQPSSDPFTNSTPPAHQQAAQAIHSKRPAHSQTTQPGGRCEGCVGSETAQTTPRSLQKGATIAVRWSSSPGRPPARRRHWAMQAWWRVLRRQSSRALGVAQGWLLRLSVRVCHAARMIPCVRSGILEG